MASSMMMLVAVILCCVLTDVSAGSFYQNFDITWGADHARILDNGELLMMSLDKVSGTGIQSKNEFLFGKFDMKLKLVPGNSAGTVTAYYLTSQGFAQDEIDFEFLGNLSGDPYILHTNVYTRGKGNREQQFYLWFDPTKDFHTYSILWNPLNIIFYVDDMPIREFFYMESNGAVLYPNKQPMKIISSLWDAENWATRGGLVKTDWSQAPFTSSASNFMANACLWASGTSSCPSKNNSWMSDKLDPTGQEKLRAVQKSFMIYNYCTDAKRFPEGLPRECNK